MLYLVPTPIGNLKDITLRALEALKEADGIICEDTRRTSLLLNHYQIKKPLLALNDFNETKVIPKILQQLTSGQNLCLVSDGGTPLISDPGYKLVRACIDTSIKVDSLPGPTSITVALSLSGLPPDKFLFLGYLPEKPSHRLQLLQKLTLIHDSIKVTYIVFVAPHKLVHTLEDLKTVLGDIEVVLAQELSKIYQSVEKNLISSWLNKFETQKPKGEYILLLRLY